MSDQSENVVIGAKLQLESAQALESVGKIKLAFKESQKALLAAQEEFGEFSKEALRAAKYTAELKDRVFDAKNLVKAFDPDRKFQAFSSSLGGAVGGVAALNGAMGLLGAEGKHAEEVLLKVQSAMALSQGLNQLLESKDAFKQLGAVLQTNTLLMKANEMANKAAGFAMKLFGVEVEATSTSFRVLKGAIAATGIGLLVLAISEVVSYFQDMTSEAERAAEAQKLLEEQTLKLAKAGKEGADHYIKVQGQLEEARAKAAGASEEDLFNIRQKWQKVQVDSDYKYWSEIKDNAEEGVKAKQAVEEGALKLEIDRLGREAKLREEAEKKREEEERKREQAEKEAARRRALLRKEAQKTINELTAQANADAAGQSSPEAEELKKIEEEYKAKVKIITAGGLSIQAAERWLAEERAKIFRKYDDEDRKKFLETVDAKEKAEADLAKQLQDEWNKEVQAHREAAMTVADDQTKSLEYRKNAIAFAESELVKSTKLSEDQRNQLEANFSAARIEIAKQERDAKKQFYSDMGNALTALSQLIGQQTAAGKALAIAQATINTWLGVTEVLKTKSVLPEPMATISRVANIVAVVASGLTAIKNIVKTNVPGASGGAGAGAAALNSASAPLSAKAGATLTQLDASSVNAMGNQAIKTYVVESDVTNNQEKIKRLNRAARIGG